MNIMMLKTSPFDTVANAIMSSTFQKWFAVFLSLIMILMVFDLITGYMKAFVTKELSSKVGSKGLMKKLANLIAFLFGALIDICAIVFDGTFVNILTVNVSFMCIIGGYIAANECISVIENLSKVSPNLFPKWVKKFFKEVKDNIDNVGDSNKM